METSVTSTGLPVDWPFPDLPRPTYTETLRRVATSLAGPYPGPNRAAMAGILAVHYLRLIEQRGGRFWLDDTEAADQ
ncbi:hypothetical protein [Mycobacterium phage Weirdo19]|uniref:Uncharacterized protein n=1 Tax=Mycobacterium phage Weirdo19 TaxID=2601610 RepID=A0A6M2YSY1_9CAUD|nr:hypothetical protein KDJ11_gp79 [Mycobacterium phage Weirdo19]QEA10847.1 hypothetical protein [Mycobacterium phage Weirdo19]